MDDLLKEVPAAYDNFERKRKEIGYTSDWVIFIKLADNAFLRLPLNGEGTSVVTETEIAPSPPHTLTHSSAPSNIIERKYIRVELDSRLLLKALRGPRFAHWNNIELGNHITYELHPNVFERAAYHCLYFFHLPAGLSKSPLLPVLDG